MSMSTPFEPNLGPPDDGIPAADPGAGAPPPADGYGEPEGEPDRPAEATRPPAEGGDAHADPEEDPPFRTPDPHDIGPVSEN